MRKYPELDQGISMNKQAKSKINSKEYELKKRSGKRSEKDIFRERLKKIFASSKNKQEFFNNLFKEKIRVYVRGKTIGFLDERDNKKHRLKTLGLVDEFERMNKDINLEHERKEEENKKEHERKTEEKKQHEEHKNKQQAREQENSNFAKSENQKADNRGQKEDIKTRTNESAEFGENQSSIQ